MLPLDKHYRGHLKRYMLQTLPEGLITTGDAHRTQWPTLWGTIHGPMGVWGREEGRERERGGGCHT